ncbi:MAG TPA: ATP-binding protein [Solirubrobacteraceae bacterium]|nr:ATP-binding protein [Solirubrobacteraceae bacterium]
MNASVTAAHLRLELSSRADNVPLVRQVLAGVADVTSLPSADLSDIGTATTEACNNVAMHAYAGGEGPLEVELLVDGSSMAVTVRDRGVGLAIGLPRSGFPPDVDGELSGIGVLAILALARSVRWSAPDGGGTAVEMAFSTGLPTSAEASSIRRSLAPLAIAPAQLADTVEVEMAPLAVARGVLPRLLRAVATRAHFSIDRHSDAQRVGTALLADDSIWDAAGGVQARLAVVDSATLEVAIGPLDAHEARRTADAARAVDSGLDTSIMPFSRGERLVVRMGRARP